MTIRATVTADVGRTGTARLLTIGDATGGIGVRLPAELPAPGRGQFIEVTGTLAAPYGQLEIRAVASGLVVIGPGTLPEPVTLADATVGEATEGRLVVVTGVVPKRPTKGSGGDLTLALDRPGTAPLKVLADLSSGVSSTAFEAGATYRLTGIIGQRASRTGALDGYRLWLRDASDVVRTAAPAPTVTPSPHPTATPRPSTTATPRPSASPKVGVVSIATAKGRRGQAVTILAVVTAGSTLLDASRRRIVVQDASAGIEVHLPKDMPAPALGTRIRVVGKVGTAYGAPRIEATTVAHDGSTALPAPIVLHISPTEALEWRLVSVHGRIESVRKLGDRWRAEIRVGTAAVVILGQSGARIPVTAMIEGREVTVVGIVRRPYPTATDRRFAILPRRTSDIDLGAASPASAPAGSSASASRGGTSSPTTTSGATTAAGQAPSGADAIPDADLRDLGSFVGRTVRVGGLVSELRADGFRLDDGTATGTVVVRGSAAELLDLIDPDDAVNVTGTVQRAADGPVVAVSDPAGLSLAGAPAPPATSPSSRPVVASGDPAATATPARGTTRRANLSPFPADGAISALGAGALVGLTAASLAVTLLRRRYLQRRLTARIAARLATIAAPRAADPTE